MNGAEEAVMTGTQPAIVLLAAMLFLTLVIERLLEIVKSYYDYLEAKRGWHTYWNKSAEKIQSRMESMLKSRVALTVSTRLGYSRLKVEENAYKESLTISVAVVRSYTIKYIAKCLGMALGIVVALCANIDLFHLIDVSIYGDTVEPSKFPILAKIISGMAMGLGSGTVHKIIAALDKAKKRRQVVSE